MGSDVANNSETVLVTGGSGFIGSNFIRYVLEKRPEHQIINLDALTYAGNPLNLENMALEDRKRYRFVRGDIRDIKLLDKLFGENSITGVIHFAAESHVDRSIVGPEAFVETNVLGTFRLLEAAHNTWRATGCASGFRFLHVSTDEVAPIQPPRRLQTISSMPTTAPTVFRRLSPIVPTISVPINFPKN